MYFKMLDHDKSRVGIYTWSLPELKFNSAKEEYEWIPGEWTHKIEGNLKLCFHGYHIVKDDHLLAWCSFARDIYECEPKYRMLHESPSKTVARQVRLLRGFPLWRSGGCLTFSLDCMRASVAILSCLTINVVRNHRLLSGVTEKNFNIFEEYLVKAGNAFNEMSSQNLERWKYIFSNMAGDLGTFNSSWYLLDSVLGNFQYVINNCELSMHKDYIYKNLLITSINIARISGEILERSIYDGSSYDKIENIENAMILKSYGENKKVSFIYAMLINCMNGFSNTGVISDLNRYAKNIVSAIDKV